MASRSSGTARVELVLRALQDELVVHLQHEPRREPAALQLAAHGDHGHLDDVGRGALQDGVHGEPLAQRAVAEVGRAQLGHGAPAAEQRGHVAVLGGLRDHALAERLDVRVLGEVRVDEGAGLVHRDVDLLGEPERREAVHDAEVGRLGALALLLGDLLDRDAGDRGGGDAVHVLAAVIGVQQRRLAGRATP